FSANITPDLIEAYLSGLRDADPLVRIAAIGALEPFGPKERLQAAGALLTDPVRGVRIAAARLLAPVHPDVVTSQQSHDLDRAIGEAIDAEQASADRPESHVTLGALYAQRGKAAEAEAAYRTALRLDPRFVPAIVNLADLYRALGRDADGMLLLRQAIAIDPNNATAHHALGLAQVRIRQIDDAVASLRKASELAPENARYAYVYGIALNSAGAQGESLDVLRRAHQAHRVNFEILSALVTI